MTHVVLTMLLRRDNVADPRRRVRKDRTRCRLAHALRYDLCRSAPVEMPVAENDLKKAHMVAVAASGPCLARHASREVIHADRA